MTWKPKPDIDENVRQWMKAKGWQVTRTNYNFDREIYAWRHELRSGNSPTLRVHRKVLDSYPAFALIELLDRLRVAQAIRAGPETRLVVLQRGTDVVLEALP